MSEHRIDWIALMKMRKTDNDVGAILDALDNICSEASMFSDDWNVWVDNQYHKILDLLAELVEERDAP